MTLIGDLISSLTGDATLMATLTGGVYGVRISRTATAAAFDGTTQEIKPCAYVRSGAEFPSGPLPRGSSFVVEVYLYQRVEYGSIQTARDRIYALWHNQRIGSHVWQVQHADDANDQYDPALDCSLIVSRYQVMRNRA